MEPPREKEADKKQTLPGRSSPPSWFMPIMQDLEPLAPGRHALGLARGTLLAAGPIAGNASSCLLLGAASCTGPAASQEGMCATESVIPLKAVINPPTLPSTLGQGPRAGQGQKVQVLPAMYVLPMLLPYIPAPLLFPPHPSKLRAMGAGTQPHTHPLLCLE